MRQFDLPVMSDVIIAKNYLTEEELKILNNLVSGYFDFAEIQAIRHNPMYMDDYIKQLDTITDENRKDVSNVFDDLMSSKTINDIIKYEIAY